MKAVILDRNTLSSQMELTPPEGITQWVVYESTRPDQVVNHLEGADIAITNKVLMTREILAQLPDLRLIQVAATGINNIDAEACKTHGVQLCNVAGYSTTTVP